MSNVKVGDPAPDFRLPSLKGGEVSLSDYRGKKNVVLFFYPKDDSPGCTVEACTFRDAYQDFVDAGAEVIGISSDSLDDHAAFASKHRLPMQFVADKGGKVRAHLRREVDARPHRRPRDLHHRQGGRGAPRLPLADPRQEPRRRVAGDPARAVARPSRSSRASP